MMQHDLHAQGLLLGIWSSATARIYNINIYINYKAQLAKMKYFNKLNFHYKLCMVTTVEA